MYVHINLLNKSIIEFMFMWNSDSSSDFSSEFKWLPFKISLHLNNFSLSIFDVLMDNDDYNGDRDR